MAPRSRAELEVVPISRHLPKIKPPPGLTPPELQLFQEIVAASPPMAFVQSDARLLTAYVQSILLCNVAFDAAMASPDALRDWEKACRTMTNLARALRLAPRCRTDPKTLARSHLDLSLRETGGVTLEGLEAIRDGARGWTCKG